MKIKVITVIQPWATLIALNEKGNETRSWWTDYRGHLGIHAGMKIDYEACEEPRIKAALARHGITSPSQLPTGCIIGICQIFDCVKMVEDPVAKNGVKLPGYKLSDREYSFGHYAPGRWAWILANIKKIKPIKVRGQQRLWEHDLKLNDAS
jgi:hypothetical protein